MVWFLFAGAREFELDQIGRVGMFEEVADAGVFLCAAPYVSDRELSGD